MTSRRDQTGTVLLTVEAAAKRLSTSPRFIRRLIAERRIEFVKVGRHVRISESALAEFIEAGRVEPLTAAVIRPQRGRVMANKEGHRRFGNVRRLPSGRYQIRYPGPDGRLRATPEPSTARATRSRALVITEAADERGRMDGPERGKVKLGDYARDWVTERPGLRARTVDFYRWLLAKHIEPTSVTCPSAS